LDRLTPRREVIILSAFPTAHQCRLRLRRVALVHPLGRPLLKFKFRLDLDRHPGRKVWLGNFEDTISGLEIRARVKMKPRLLKISEDRWLRVDPEEALSIERHPDGRGIWHTLRGSFHDLDASDYA